MRKNTTRPCIDPDGWVSPNTEEGRQILLLWFAMGLPIEHRELGGTKITPVKYATLDPQRIKNWLASLEGHRMNPYYRPRRDPET